MQLQISSSRRVIAVAIAVAGLLTIGPAFSRGSVVFYTSRSAFNTAAPGLPVEDFSHANIDSGSILLQKSPVDSATNNSVLPSGSILPGLTISNANAANTPGLIVYGNGAIFGGTKSMGTNWFGDSLVLSFAPGVSAVGADVFAATSPGLTLAGDFTENVYNGSTLLGSTTFTEAQGAFGFIGVAATDPITGITLLYTTDDATTFADNIAFSSQAVPAVPEPATFSLAVLVLALLACRGGESRVRGTARTVLDENDRRC